MSKTDVLLRVFTVACLTVAIVATLYTIWMVGQSLETRFMPSVSKLQILSLEAIPDGFQRSRPASQRMSATPPAIHTFTLAGKAIMRHPRRATGGQRWLGHARTGSRAVGRSAGRSRSSCRRQAGRRGHLGRCRRGREIASGTKLINAETLRSRLR
jgi:hypothetical protein